MYEECPQKFKFKYIDRIPEKPKPYFSFGKSVHAGLEFLFSRPSGALPSIDELLAFYKENWLREGYATPEEERNYFLEGERILRGFYDKHKADKTRPLRVEYSFEIKVEGVPLIGFVDRIDKTESGGLHIIDYKTGRAFDRSRVRQDPQLTLYQMAVSQLFGLPVESLTLYHLNSLTPLTVPAHPASFEDAVRRKVAAVWSGISEGRFEPEPDEKGHCRFCDYMNLCPAYAHLRKAVVNGSPDQAAEEVAIEVSVDRYAELSKQIKELEKELESIRPAIEEYCRRKGYRRVLGKSHELLIQKLEAWKVEPEAARPILEAAGLWEEVLRYDPRAVDRLIKEGAIPVDVKEKLRKAGELVESFKILPKISDGKR